MNIDQRGVGRLKIKSYHDVIDMARQIRSRAEEAIRNKVFPGCVVKKEGERLVFPFGTFTYEKNSPIDFCDMSYKLRVIMSVCGILL